MWWKARFARGHDCVQDLFGSPDSIGSLSITSRGMRPRLSRRYKRAVIGLCISTLGGVGIGWTLAKSNLAVEFLGGVTLLIGLMILLDAIEPIWYETNEGVFGDNGKVQGREQRTRREDRGQQGRVQVV
jgi:hypothetical protein